MTRSLAVDMLLNGLSMVTSHGKFIFGGKQSSKLIRGNMAFQQNRGCNFSHFRYMVKTEPLVFLLFFAKVNCPGYENSELNLPLGLNEIYD